MQKLLKQNGRTLALLVFIVMLGLGLRMCRLGNVPYGSLIDESHFGFIAKSLLLTGKDEHGTSWPLVFKGFGDNKLPVYTYGLIPFIKLLDLSAVSIRLPSALSGTISIVLVYFLALGLFPKKKSLGLLAALTMAISPWPFMLSRFGFESNVALMWWLIALNGVVRFQKQKYWPVITALAAGLTWYTYIAYRPVTLIFLAVIFCLALVKKFFSVKRVVASVAIFVVVVLPMLLAAPDSNTTRFTQIGLFVDPWVVVRVEEGRAYCTKSLPNWYCYSVVNKGIEWGQALAKRFISSYSPEFLMVQGEVEEEYLTVEGFGQFMWVLTPFLILGFVGLWKVGTPQKRWFTISVVLVGLAVSSLPAILAGEPQKVRLSPLLPFIILLLTTGMVFTWEEITRLLQTFTQGLHRTVLSAVLLGSFFGLWFGLSCLYFTSFFAIHTQKNGQMYQSYVRDLMGFLHTKYELGANIYFNPIFADPLMFFAFYTNMDPAAYQQSEVLGGLEKSGFQHTIGLERLHVTNEDLLLAGCAHLTEDAPTYFVTNTTTSFPVAPVYLAKSPDGALVLAYVYDASEYAKANRADCNNFSATDFEKL